MDQKTQNIVAQHIIDDIQKYSITTMEAIGLLESIKLSLFNDSIKRWDMIIDINISTIESAIPASDCSKDNYLFDWRNNISYLILEV